MYTLRKITPANVEMNISLGNSYTIVSREKSQGEFRYEMERWLEQFNQDTPTPDDNQVSAFVSDQNGKIYPIFTGQKNYIVSENGKTFANLSVNPGV